MKIFYTAYTLTITVVVNKVKVELQYWYKWYNSIPANTSSLLPLHLMWSWYIHEVMMNDAVFMIFIIQLSTQCTDYICNVSHVSLPLWPVMAEHHTTLTHKLSTYLFFIYCSDSLYLYQILFSLPIMSNHTNMLNDCSAPKAKLIF